MINLGVFSGKTLKTLKVPPNSNHLTGTPQSSHWAFTRGHVSAVVDGVVDDCAAGSLKRVTMLLKLEKVEEPCINQRLTTT